MKKICYVLFGLVALTAIMGNAGESGSATTDRFALKLHTLNAIVKELQTRYVDTLAADELMDRTIGTLLYQIDPYTTYYPADEQDELLALSEGSYAGIGSMISKDKGHVIISGPYWGSPARTTGLRYGDVIVAVDGDTVTATTEISSVSRKLRGQAGTKVRVDIARPYVGSDSLMSFEITRRDIITTPMTYYGVLGDSVGLIVLTQFSESSARDVKRAVTEFATTPGLKGIVLDLRDNGGGLLESAVQISSLFIPKGTEVVRTRGRESQECIYKTTQQPVAPTMPLVILVNGNTASSSEIVAGAMQDLDRAVIMGTRTYGKGLVQTTRPLPYDDVLKITTARYYIPSGRLIQALNYAERNDDGTPTRMPDSLTTEFRTAAGRKVRDGGGITPDTEVTTPTMSRLSDRLVNEGLIFDYANRVANGSPETPAEDAVLVDSLLFEDFKQFVVQSDFNYDRNADRMLKLMREAVEYEGYANDSVNAHIDELERMLHHDLTYDLDLNRDELMSLLDTEISLRYFPDSVLVKRSVNTDPVLSAARALLHDGAAYRAILTPGDK